MAIDEWPTDSEVEAPSPHDRLRDVPGIVTLIASSWLWHTSRWCGLFSSSYLVSELVDAPFLNQLVGAVMFAPMLLGGLAAGALSDRIDRRHLVIVIQGILVPLTLVMAALIATGAVRVWMVYPFVAVLGLGWLTNMTGLRPLIYETVGPKLATRAMVVEALGVAGSAVAGSLLAGAMIQVIGLAAAYVYVAVALSISTVLVMRVPARRLDVRRQLRGPGVRETLRTSGVMLRTNATLTSVLGVTVVMDLCYVPFIPLIPVLAQEFEATPFMTGMLGGAAGVGQLFGTLLIAWRGVHRRGHVYVLGSALALTGLALFSMAPVLALAFLALSVGGIGQAGFVSMQGVLVIDSVSARAAGAAQGLLSTAVGSLPIGMLCLGVAATVLGPSTALLVSSLVGLTLLVGWTTWRPQALGDPRRSEGKTEVGGPSAASTPARPGA